MPATIFTYKDLIYVTCIVVRIFVSKTYCVFLGGFFLSFLSLVLCHFFVSFLICVYISYRRMFIVGFKTCFCLCPARVFIYILSHVLFVYG